MGGFLTGQNNVDEAHATEKEMKQKIERNDAVSKLKASGVFGKNNFDQGNNRRGEKHRI